MQQTVPNFTERLQTELNKALSLIDAQQLPSGEFQTFELYPTLNPGQWIKGPSSPFVTASILIALADVNHPLAKSISDKGALFIQSTEEKGLWRFWKNGTSDNDVPCDADDTSLCSFALARIKKANTSNQNLFAANRNAQGLFYTWFMPRMSFLSSPLRLLSLMQDAKIAKATIEKGFLDKEDVEIAVMANVLLYLGEKAVTQPAIDFVIHKIKAGTPYPMHFYATDVIVWYHIARAHHYSVPSLNALGQTFAAYFKQKEKELDLSTNLPLALALYNSACYFNLAGEAANLLARILEADKAINFPYPYFTSKNRIYNAGAAPLTLSWYAEALQNALTQHS